MSGSGALRRGLALLLLATAAGRIPDGDGNGHLPGGVVRAQRQVQGAFEGSRDYSGDPVSMEFQNADLRSVLRTFVEISELNLVIDPQVAGTVDVALVDVPWDQAFDVILRANRLGYVVDGTVVRIAPMATLAAEPMGALRPA